MQQHKKVVAISATRSTKSIPDQLRDETGYINSARVMEILKIGKSAYYAQVKSGLIHVMRRQGKFKIDPFVLADQLEKVTT